MEPPKWRLRENTDRTPWWIAVFNGLFAVIGAIFSMIGAMIREIFS